MSFVTVDFFKKKQDLHLSQILTKCSEVPEHNYKKCYSCFSRHEQTLWRNKISCQ